MDNQAEIESQRPHIPSHAALKDTCLADKLVHHPGHYKTVIDTLRVALANIESELAARLAPGLPCPLEAKKTLANLLVAPGRLRLSPGILHVDLSPAATAPERKARRRHDQHPALAGAGTAGPSPMARDLDQPRAAPFTSGFAARTKRSA